MNKPIIEGGGEIEGEIVHMIISSKYFYAYLLQQFTRHIVDSNSKGIGQTVKTLAVNIDNNLLPNLYINRNFYNSGDGKLWGLLPSEKVAILEHEVCHIIMKHYLREEKRNHYIWQLAVDLVVNQYIKGLPYGAFCDLCGIFIRKLSNDKFPSFCPMCQKVLDKKRDVFSPLDIKNFYINDRRIKLEAGKTAEEYYDILQKEIPKNIVTLGMRRISAKEKAIRKALDGKSEESNNKVEESSEELQEIPKTLDDHEVWSIGSDDSGMTHEKIKDIVRRTVQKIGEKNQGNISAWLQGFVEVCLSHKTVNWRSELRSFVGYKVFSKLETTRKRPNRRYPLQPGFKVLRKAHMLVCVDTSGSIGEKEHANFWGEINRMFNAGITITVVGIDAEVNNVERYLRKPDFKKEIKRYGYGGTNFCPAFKFANEKKCTIKGKEIKLKESLDGIIYLTDGYGTYPNKKDIKYPTIWVMTKNHSLNGWNKGLGKVIIMEDN